ncbi:putative MFS family arabinose efflux permease [Kribbella voronezhensis]|uniref:Putative MFS family arabinose efflux permease n=1 Tax=Kribbella voronezhensis TaxID=2512212 RepID=A0A4R7SWF8_9ACTN|nr:YbfB/YjiJ family MFS transporter [Kribbella voronezhensis]TDU83682.1 putative MFS family arabinose efflux permease [Kribbella voronezhensis]
MPSSTTIASVRPWRLAGEAATALAVGMGVGRFVFTPILPLMQAQARMSPRLGAGLATANYVGYLIGALAAIVMPALIRSRPVLRGSLLVLIGTLALMPISTSGGLWTALRLVAGIASAVIFVIAVSGLLTSPAKHLIGWAFGGIGAGIALSGAAVLLLRTTGSWRAAWWSAAALSVVLTIPAWQLRLPDHDSQEDPQLHPGGRWFAALVTSYSLEGVGYIIAGTFLVAAINQTVDGRAGAGAWVLVGLAAVPSTALWAGLSRTWSRPTLLFAALLVQAVGIALPAISSGVSSALISATLFGATFLGIGSIALAIGAHLQIPRAVAILTTGYSIGQILGPLAVAPLLHNGYHQALLIGSGVVALAAIAAGVLRHRFPHHLGPLPSRVQLKEIQA